MEMGWAWKRKRALPRAIFTSVRILILSWRCPKNPRSGGAEVLTYEVAKRLVAAGDEVEWFTGSYPMAVDEESMDGVHIVRGGKQSTVHLHALSRYRGKLRKRFDAVVNEV